MDEITAVVPVDVANEVVSALTILTNLQTQIGTPEASEATNDLLSRFKSHLPS